MNITQNEKYFTEDIDVIKDFFYICFGILFEDNYDWYSNIWWKNNWIIISYPNK